MHEHADPLRFPLQHHLDVLTTQAGWHLDPDALDPTLALFGELVTTLIDATARHATATHLWHLLDGPLSFLLEVITGGPIDNHDAELLLLATLLQLRERMRQQREQAAQDVSDTCDKLNAVGLTTPVTGDFPPHRSGRTDRDTAVVAALVDAGFVAGLTEHRANSINYQTACDGDTVRADLAADGCSTLHSTGTGADAPWQVTASGSVLARPLAALIRARTTADHQPTGAASTPPHPDRDCNAAVDPPRTDPPWVNTRPASSTGPETAGRQPHGRLGL